MRKLHQSEQCPLTHIAASCKKIHAGEEIIKDNNFFYSWGSAKNFLLVCTQLLSRMDKGGGKAEAPLETPPLCLGIGDYFRGQHEPRTGSW